MDFMVSPKAKQQQALTMYAGRHACMYVRTVTIYLCLSVQMQTNTVDAVLESQMNFPLQNKDSPCNDFSQAMSGYS